MWRKRLVPQQQQLRRPQRLCLVEVRMRRALGAWRHDDLLERCHCVDLRLHRQSLRHACRVAC